MYKSSNFYNNFSIFRISLLTIALLSIMSLYISSCNLTNNGNISSGKPSSVSLSSNISPTNTMSDTSSISIDNILITPLPTIQEPREIIEITKPSTNAEGLVFQPLSVRKRYLIDLNSDGIKEDIMVAPDTVQNSYVELYSLYINNERTPLNIDSQDWSQSWIVLTDLDITDKFLDLLYLGGTYSWYLTYFYYYDGKKAISRGLIDENYFESLAYDESIQDFYDYRKPIGLKSKYFNGHGKVTQRLNGCPLSSLGTYEKIWKINLSNNPLLINENEYAKIKHPPLKLKMDLPLYSDTSNKTLSFIVKKGEMVDLNLIYNEWWYQIKTKNGKT